MLWLSYGRDGEESQGVLDDPDHLDALAGEVKVANAALLSVSDMERAPCENTGGMGTRL